MPLINSKSRDAFTGNLKAELAAGKPKAQALAIAYSEQRRAPKAAGGPVMPHIPGVGHMGERPSGMIHSAVPGRTDKLPMNVAGGSYVIPADVVSAVGQGNSAAGANGFSKLFKLGPYSVGPAMAPPRMHAVGRADGGATDSGVPIIAAGGEFIVPPETVREIGGGDMDKGHQRLDDMVLHIRKKTVKTLRKLPPPKKR